MSKSLAPSVVVAALLVAGPAPALTQERLQGKVVATMLTHCDFKPGGCAGNLTLETTPQGQASQVMIDVPLGTPIRKGNETVYLPALRGKAVNIVLVTEKGKKTARSVDVKAEKP